MNKATLENGIEIENRIKRFEGHCPKKDSKFETVQFGKGMDGTITSNILSFKYNDEESKKLFFALKIASIIIVEAMHDIYDDMCNELDNLQDEHYEA